jgi:hypothetical protein
MRSPGALPAMNRPGQDADDALTALLSARGLI